jgi:restriction system protein
VLLIDGDILANLMIDHGVRASTQRSYEIKRVDSDYFSEARVLTPYVVLGLAA